MKLALPWDEQLPGKLDDLWGMLEETAIKYKVEVSIHTKPKGKAKNQATLTKKTKRENTEHWSRKQKGLPTPPP